MRLGAELGLQAGAVPHTRPGYVALGGPTERHAGLTAGIVLKSPSFSEDDDKGVNS